MIFSPTYRNKIFYQLICLLLVAASIMAPVVSVLAEQHELQHISSGDIHFNTQSNHSTHANLDQNSDTEESSLHYLAHASHCCGHIVAMLPDLLQLIMMPAQSALDTKRVYSHFAYLRITHFRPPIFL
jgi:hypothetical protein